MIIGDVMTAVFIVVFFGLSLWASCVLGAVAFPERVRRCADAFVGGYWKSLGIGALVGAPMVFVGIALLQHPVLRIFGILVLGFVVLLALLGSSGLVRAVADYVQAAGGAKTDYEAVAKAGLLVVLFAFLPLFGWFIVMPLVLVASIGAGIKGLASGERKKAPEAA